MTWVIPVRRVGKVIVPDGIQASDDLAKNVHDGQFFIIEGRSTRNPRHLAKFWTLVNLVAQATDRTPEEIRRWVSYKLNFVDVYIDPWGREQTIPRSIALTSSLSQAEFRDFFDRAVSLMAEKLLGTSKTELIVRFEEVMMGRAP